MPRPPCPSPPHPRSPPAVPPPVFRPPHITPHFFPIHPAVSEESYSDPGAGCYDALRKEDIGEVLGLHGSGDEMAFEAGRIFSEMDTDGDHHIDIDEFV